MWDNSVSTVPSPQSVPNDALVVESVGSFKVTVVLSASVFIVYTFLSSGYEGPNKESKTSLASSSVISSALILWDIFSVTSVEVLYVD